MRHWNMSVILLYRKKLIKGRKRPKRIMIGIGTRILFGTDKFDNGNNINHFINFLSYSFFLKKFRKVQHKNTKLSLCLLLSSIKLKRCLSLNSNIILDKCTWNTLNWLGKLLTVTKPKNWIGKIEMLNCIEIEDASKNS